MTVPVCLADRGRCPLSRNAAGATTNAGAISVSGSFSRGFQGQYATLDQPAA